VTSCETIRCEVEDGIATLTLNRPDRLNALNLTMFAELSTALGDLAADRRVGCLVLTGAGSAFCAGFDLKDPVLDRGEAPSPDNPAHSDVAVMKQIWDFPHPKVIAVNGVAAGGGVGIALSGDIVIAARSARFVQTFVPRLGTIPDLGCTWTVPHKVGRAKALGMALLGEPLYAEQAADWGLIWACVEDDELQERAREIAARLRDSSPTAIRETRRLIDRAATVSFDDQVREERCVAQEIIRTPDFAEALSAFRERRKPRFR